MIEPRLRLAVFLTGIFLAGCATDKWLTQEFEVFQRSFGKVVHAGSLPGAWAAGVDLVAVLDVYEQSGA